MMMIIRVSLLENHVETTKRRCQIIKRSGAETLLFQDNQMLMTNNGHAVSLDDYGWDFNLSE